MTPVRVQARLWEGLVLRHPVHLDALLQAAWCMREGRLLAPLSEADLIDIQLPLARSECGRYWLASAGALVPLASELRYKNRRAPWVEYARLGSDKIRRVQINFGENKSYRVPYEFTIPKDGLVTWWALGELGGVCELLQHVHFLAKHRGSGKGHVREWKIEECEPWGDGFPVMRDGYPLRNLPVEPGAVGALERCEPPYWMREGRVPCLVPVSG